jgi:hypothetical protein
MLLQTEISLQTLLELNATQNEAVFCQNQRRQIVEENKYKSNRQINEEIKTQCDRTLKRFNELIRNEGNILNNRLNQAKDFNIK